MSGVGDTVIVGRSSNAVASASCVIETIVLVVPACLAPVLVEANIGVLRGAATAALSLLAELDSTTAPPNGIPKNNIVASTVLML